MKTTLILAICLLFLIAFNACMPFMQMQTAQAKTFNQHIPSFGLYCKDKDVISSGAVKYDLSNFDTITQNSGAMHSQYQLAAVNREVELCIPFISSAIDVPTFNVTASGQKINGSVWYGDVLYTIEQYADYETLIEKTYSPVMDENLKGTLYTIIPNSDTVAIELTFAEGDNDSFIYETPNNFASSNTANGTYTWTFNDALINSEYKFFILGDIFDFSFACSSHYRTETMSCKKFIDSQYESLKEIYNDYGVEIDFIYSIFNSVLHSKLGITYDDLFFNSINAHRLNTYKFSLYIDAATVVSYDLPLNIQSNYDFIPPIYSVEQKNLGNYPIRYTIELKSGTPYIIETSVQTVKNGITYSAETEDDYYFVFSSSEKPKNPAQDNNTDTKTTVIICCSIIGGVALISLAVLIGFKINKKARRRQHTK